MMELNCKNLLATLMILTSTSLVYAQTEKMVHCPLPSQVEKDRATTKTLYDRFVKFSARNNDGKFFTSQVIRECSFCDIATGNLVPEVTTYYEGTLSCAYSSGVGPVDLEPVILVNYGDY